MTIEPMVLAMVVVEIFLYQCILWQQRVVLGDVSLLKVFRLGLYPNGAAHDTQKEVFANCLRTGGRLGALYRHHSTYTHLYRRTFARTGLKH